VRRVLAGSLALSQGAYDAHFGQAQRVRALVARDFAAVFAAGCDVVLVPTAPTAAPSLAAAAQLSPTAAMANDVFTVPSSLAGSARVARLCLPMLTTRSSVAGQACRPSASPRGSATTGSRSACRLSARFGVLGSDE
jgi:Asp-tRNA(Asn)/Glu-tRNA(Gln) amidotransferase A subunit family amidase